MAHQGNNGGVQDAGPSTTPIDDEMLVPSEEESEPEDNPRAEVLRLRRQAKEQTKQLADMQSLINQIMSQFMATPNEKPPPKPKMAVPEKYEGGRNELRTFLTNIDLYCGFNQVPNDQEKILMANTHMKGKAAMWMQPYVEDFLAAPSDNGTREETRALFKDWNSFKEEMSRIFGEVDAKNQAEKAITRLRQTKSVSAYTAEFKQLQARIDWDDAALRTVFEAGLKEDVKDGLVHHEKPETLHALVELATRIDNRLWERKEQKKRQTQPTAANMKKYRSRTDKDGDTIMTGKVQEKSKDKKTRGKNHDGLSKEERQKRYDNKACLRCGEVGHFRRDCPKIEESKQAVVKIKVLRMEPMPEDDNLSDLDLYEEARLAESTDYVVIPELIRADKCMKWEVPRESDWTVTDTDAQRRLALNQCWVCGDATHQADDCDLREGRIAVIGPNAKEVVEQAIQKQPYFTTDLPKAEDAPEEEHEKLSWAYCKRGFCMYHADAKEQCRIDENSPEHRHLWANDCPILDCHVHKEEHQAEHERLTWINCMEKCRFHRNQRIEAREESNYLHNLIPTKECRTIGCRRHGTEKIRSPDTLEEMIPHENVHWSFCIEDHCMVHRSSKDNYGYFPRKQKGKRLEGKGHTKN